MGRGGHVAVYGVGWGEVGPTWERSARVCAMWAEMGGRGARLPLVIPSLGLWEGKIQKCALTLERIRAGVTWGVTEGVSEMEQLGWGRKHTAGHPDERTLE